MTGGSRARALAVRRAFLPPQVYDYVIVLIIYVIIIIIMHKIMNGIKF